jgi:hypothetical protein
MKKIQGMQVHILLPQNGTSDYQYRKKKQFLIKKMSTIYLVSTYI